MKYNSCSIDPRHLSNPSTALKRTEGLATSAQAPQSLTSLSSLSSPSLLSSPATPVSKKEVLTSSTEISPSPSLSSSKEKKGDKKKKLRSSQPSPVKSKRKNNKKQKQALSDSSLNLANDLLVHRQLKDIKKFVRNTPKNTLTEIPLVILPLPSSSQTPTTATITSTATTPRSQEGTTPTFSAFDYLIDLNCNPIAQL
eukprot:TRINITY_DN4094_c0_g1_i1.p1 TRINITY_DN4094_c0_g1~~TRINITY_DN4094_c0_g1_i1.p1  ORF type:complete len:198 (+),score=53.96 TRINITY_DN4094_c0_g1_i1:208-801(+)